MPNWCMNSLSGPKGFKRKLKNLLDSDGNLDFQKIIPCPEAILKTDDEWYYWRIEKWGTKWSSTNCSFSRDGKTVDFDTAWSPPLPVIRRLSEILKVKLTLLYAEPGLDFYGELTTTERGGAIDTWYDGWHEVPLELRKVFKTKFGVGPISNEEHEGED